MNKMICASSSFAAIHGIWCVALLPWDTQDSLDMKTFDANLDRVLAGEPNGIYTLDTASEFYTLELEEWRWIARRFVDRCRKAASAVPVGLGCTWTNQEGALARIREARDLGVATIHLSPPYWLPLNEDGLLRFFSVVQAQVGHLKVIIYAPPWGRLNLDAALYERIIEEAPAVVGTKTMGKDSTLLRSPAQGPRHSHFVHESVLVEAVRFGASGSYSALAGLSIRYMKEWWATIERGEWEAALKQQEAVNRFYQAGVYPIRERGILGCAIDKALAQVGGACGSRRLRSPYPCVPDDLFTKLRQAATKYLPEAFENRA